MEAGAHWLSERRCILPAGEYYRTFPAANLESDEGRVTHWSPERNTHPSALSRKSLCTYMYVCIDVCICIVIHT